MSFIHSIYSCVTFFKISVNRCTQIHNEYVFDMNKNIIGAKLAKILSWHDFEISKKSKKLDVSEIIVR